MTDYSAIIPGRDWRWEQAVWAPAEQQAALRKALLQRIADRLAYARALAEGTMGNPCWPCCWVRYEWTRASSGRTEGWLYRLCEPRTCPHWHHGAEVFLA